LNFESTVDTLDRGEDGLCLFFPWTFGDRSQVVRVRLLVVIGMVVAFAIVGAGWKWSKTAQPKTQPHAGWSWDGVVNDSSWE
jgi:hypothetical protein